jgi:hypothetical protein
LDARLAILLCKKIVGPKSKVKTRSNMAEPSMEEYASKWAVFASDDDMISLYT